MLDEVVDGTHFGHHVRGLVGTDADLTIVDLEVEDTIEEPRSMTRFDGQNAVSLVVQKQSGTNTVEVIDGLAEGDRVILSDMSSWDASERVRLR